MSDDEFGFSDESANREADPFAGMSEQEFNLLINISTVIMEKRGITDRREAIEHAKQVKNLTGLVTTGSGRVGVRKYGEENFRNFVVEALIKGEEPCTHGHISSITTCGTCEKQRLVDQYVKNPTPSHNVYGEPIEPIDGLPVDEAELRASIRGGMKRCTHTRVNLPPYPQVAPPCPACKSEEDEILGYHLQKRAEYEEATKSSQDRKKAAAAPARPISQLKKLLQQTSSVNAPAPVQRLEEKEAEMNALIGLLLDRLGGEVELGPEDMERFKEMARLGEATYSVSPSVTSMALEVKRVGPTGRRSFRSGGYVKPPFSVRANPSARSGPTAWLGANDPDDDEDLPF